jgi:hypothetical protein
MNLKFEDSSIVEIKMGLKVGYDILWVNSVFGCEALELLSFNFCI